MKGKYKVYRLTFSDGFEYIGITSKTVEQRIKKHRHNWRNADLLKQLRKEYPKIEIITDRLHKRMALTKEQIAIHESKKPMNKNIRSKKTLRKPRNNEVREGEYVCSICRVEKPHTEYHRDCTRFNGLDSRCIDCSRYRFNFGLKSYEIRELLRVKNEK